MRSVYCCLQMKLAYSKGAMPDLLFLIFTILLTCRGMTGQAQNSQITVTGTVLEAGSKNDPVIAATVNVIGTTKSAITDLNGNFKILAPADGKLKISAMGFVSQEVPVAAKLVIKLEASTSNLDEVVIVAYGTQKKGSVSGAVSSINNDDLNRTPTVTTAGALVGKVQGITARQNTGRPGANATLQIRNLGTPLYVIDGVPQSEGQFNNIAMEDIENISILKDASAAVYGFRASNGVVLVTTKKGRKGRNEVNVNSYYALQNITRYLSAADAGAYMRAFAEAEQNDNATTRTVTQEMIDKWTAGTEPGYQSTNYRDFVLQKDAPQKYLNINARGATDNINYYLSLGRLDQEAVLKQYNFNRSNFQANVEGTVLKNVKIGAQLSGRIEARHNVASTTTGNTFDNPFLAILTMWPTEKLYANDNPNYINANINNPSRNPLLYDEKIVGAEDNIWNNFGSIFYTSVQLPKGFSAKATYSYNYKTNKNELQRKNFNTYTYVPATDTYRPLAFNLALRNKTRLELKEDFVQTQLNYLTSLGAHNISAMGAFEYASQETQSIGINSVPPNNYISPIGLEEVNGLADTYEITKRASVIGRFNYDFKSKYLLEVSGRYDGSHLYAVGKRWGLFPGISAGWRVSEEGFFKKYLPAVSNFKVRGSWGRAGQERGVTAFDYLSGANFRSGNYVFDSGVIPGAAIRGLPVTNITWVTSDSWNGGFEIGLLKNKLTAEIDVFERKLSGLPAPRYDQLLPSEVGYGLPNENLESEATKGIEGLIGFASRFRNVDYSIRANATLGRRKILDRYKPRFGNSWDEYRFATEDRWADIDWGYQVEGQFQSMEQIKNWPVNNDNQGNRTLLPGDLIFKDINGDGIITQLDERPIGYALGANPYLSFGFNTGLSYKGISINTDWAGGSMQSFYRIFELAIPFQAIHNAPNYIFNDRWHRADIFDANSEWIPGKYPAIRRNGSGNHRNYTAHSSFWMKNVQYLRLKNLEIAYSLPRKFISKAKISNVRLYATGTNLLSFDNVKDIEIDPEITLNSGLVYPNTKLYTFGLNFTL